MSYVSANYLCKNVKFDKYEWGRPFAKPGFWKRVVIFYVLEFPCPTRITFLFRFVKVEKLF